MYIFYCTGGKFGEVARVFLAHRTQAAEAPDAEPARLVCCQCLTVLGLGTGRSAPDAG